MNFFGLAENTSISTNFRIQHGKNSQTKPQTASQTN
jgi:hypothetical protein